MKCGVSGTGHMWCQIRRRGQHHCRIGGQSREGGRGNNVRTAERHSLLAKRTLGLTNSKTAKLFAPAQSRLLQKPFPVIYIQRELVDSQIAVYELKKSLREIESRVKCMTQLASYHLMQANWISNLEAF